LSARPSWRFVAKTKEKTAHALYCHCRQAWLMTERPRWEAISYIPVAARKELVATGELNCYASTLLAIVLDHHVSRILEPDNYYKIKLLLTIEF
jgi:hypothetical protein